MIHAANRVTFNLGNDVENFNKKWQVTACNGMSCSLETRLELYFGQQDYESLWIAYWLFCGLNWEP
jgi:hypothetical protein